jgi:hypothetical protein
MVESKENGRIDRCVDQDPWIKKDDGYMSRKQDTAKAPSSASTSSACQSLHGA